MSDSGGDSDGSFGWVPVKLEPKSEKVPSDSKKKKKSQHEFATDGLNDILETSRAHKTKGKYEIYESSKNLDNVEVNGVTKKNKKGKHKVHNVSDTSLDVSDLKAKNSLLYESDADITNESHKKSKKKSKVSLDIDLVAKNNLLHSDSDKEIKKKRKSRKALNSSTLLQSDSENEKKKRKSTKVELPLGFINPELSITKVSSRKRTDYEEQSVLYTNSENEIKKKRKKSSKIDEVISNLDGISSEVTIKKVRLDNSLNDTYGESAMYSIYGLTNEVKQEIPDVNGNSFIANNVYKKSPIVKSVKSRTLKKEKNTFTRVTLDNYLTANKSLIPEQIELDGSVAIEKDDEIWLMTCPKNLPLQYLQSLKLIPHGKTKLHCNDITFECNMNNFEAPNNHINLITHSRTPGTCNIETKVIKGNVKITEKLPKCTPVLDNFAEEDIEAVLFPEVKCRHPFFGPNYEEYVNINPTVSMKLRKAREYKPRKSVKAEIVTENGFESDERKPSKKRKGIDYLQVTPIKKIKQEIESDNQWESAQSIENKLFNVSHENIKHSKSRIKIKSEFV